MIRCLAVLLALASPLAAQETDSAFRSGGDVFRAGGAVTIEGGAVDDAFAAGERVEIAGPITGTALLAARRVTVGGAVGGDVFAMGADVTIDQSVAGDATVMGYDVTVNAPVGGDLRAAARHVRIAAPVGGTALLAAASVAIDAAIAGDAVVTAEALSFGPEARVEGRLILYGDDGYGDDGHLTVPAAVVPADRIERRVLSRPEAERKLDRARGWLALGVGFAVGALILAAVATVVASIAPERLEGLRAIVGARPFRTFLVGFVTQAALIGAAVLLTLSLIGIPAVPVLLLGAAALAALGYVIGVYLAGLALWDAIGQLPPDSLGERALAALLGAVAAGLLALVPFLGWLAVLALGLTGLGALSAAVLRPELRA